MTKNRYWDPNAYARQDGKLAVVTGTGGLGLAVAQQLAGLGADIVLAGRNAQKGEAAVKSLNAVNPVGNHRFELVDLASLASVEAFSDRMATEQQPIDILMNNAGIMSPPTRTLTADGYEAQFGVNHLGHFALTARLLPLLCASGSGRVVNVTSLAQHQGKIDFDDLQSEREYKAGVVYCRSKLAVAIFSHTLHRKAREHGWPIASIAAHPGFSGTNLFAAQSGEKSFINRLAKWVIVPLIGQSAQEGALPSLYAAASPSAESGHLYGPTGFMRMKGTPGENRFADAVHEQETADRLWEVSEQLCRVTFDGS